ncbi:hydrogenase expression/formation protein HypE [bacterium]|nr:hydrogenase expression/formation protein HypE [bacterium]
MKETKIIRAHGLGGEKTRELIEEIIIPIIDNPYAKKLDDGAEMPWDSEKVIFTTDSFVVSPAFFPKGNIGGLSVAGTVNDIVAQGGIPRFLSMTFILEEGFEISSVKKIVRAAADEAESAGVKIVCGDVKVVEKGHGDGIYVTTSGIGTPFIMTDPEKIQKEASILVAGTVGDHGAAIFQARNSILEENEIVKSDCREMTDVLKALTPFKDKIRFMRDPTRGGLAQVMIELARLTVSDLEIDERMIPLKPWVKGLTYITGMDPLYLACEGNMIIVCDRDCESEVEAALKENGFPESSVIGHFSGKSDKPSAIMRTLSGGKRRLTSSDIVQIPRIC